MTCPVINTVRASRGGRTGQDKPQCWTGGQVPVDSPIELISALARESPA
jgi:hypothetical protein